MAHEALGIIQLSRVVKLVFAIIEITIWLLVVSVEKWCILSVHRSVHDRMLCWKTLSMQWIYYLWITTGRWWMECWLWSSAVLPLFYKWTKPFGFVTSRSMDRPWSQVGTVRSVPIRHRWLEFFVIMKVHLILRLSWRSWWLSSLLLLHCEFLCCNWLLPSRDLFRDDPNDRLRNLALRILITTKL